MPRLTARYRHRPDQDEEVIALLAELSERFPEGSFSKLFQLIQRRGLVWNHKRFFLRVLLDAAKSAPPRA